MWVKWKWQFDRISRISWKWIQYFSKFTWLLTHFETMFFISIHLTICMLKGGNLKFYEQKKFSFANSLIRNIFTNEKTFKESIVWKYFMKTSILQTCDLANTWLFKFWSIRKRQDISIYINREKRVFVWEACNLFRGNNITFNLKNNIYKNTINDWQSYYETIKTSAHVHT